MAFRLLAASPVGWIRNNYATTNVPQSSTWTALINSATSAQAKVPSGATAIEVFDSSGSTMELAVGASGAQLSLNFLIPPGGDTILVPVPLTGGALLWARAKDSSASTGELVLNFYG